MKRIVTSVLFVAAFITGALRPGLAQNVLATHRHIQRHRRIMAR
jgi:hypothetical protein